MGSVIGCRNLLSCGDCCCLSRQRWEACYGRFETRRCEFSLGPVGTGRRSGCGYGGCLLLTVGLCAFATVWVKFFFFFFFFLLVASTLDIDLGWGWCLWWLEVWLDFRIWVALVAFFFLLRIWNFCGLWSYACIWWVE